MNLRLTNAIRTIYDFAKSSVSCSFGPMATKLTAIRDYVNRTIQNDQAYQLIISALTADPDIIHDDIIEGTSIGKNASIEQQITYDTYKLILDAFSDASNILNNAGSVSDPTDFTIIDGDGLSYGFRFVDGNIYSETNYDGTGKTSFFLRADPNGSYYIQNLLPALYTKGCGKTLTSFVNSIATVSTLNGIVYTVGNLLVDGRLNESSIYSSLSEFVNSSNSAVNGWAKTFINIFNQGGTSAVVNYIISTLKSVHDNTTADKDGVLMFSDNKSLIPQQFIGTMLSSIASSAGSLMIVFGGAIVKALGVVATAGSAIYNWFKNSVWDQYNSETLSGLIDTASDFSSTVLPEFPHAMCQFDDYLNNSRDHTLFDAMSENVGTIVIDVPGGLMHIGPSSDPEKVRYEFHPYAFWTYHEYNSDYWRVEGSTPSTYSIVSILRAPIGITLRSIAERWNNGFEVTGLLGYNGEWNQQGAMVFDETSDQILRRVCVRNTALFLLWLNAADYEYDNSNYCPLALITDSVPRYGFVADAGDSGYINMLSSSMISIFKSLTIPVRGETMAIRNWTARTKPASNYNISSPSWDDIGKWFVQFHDTASIAKSDMEGMFVDAQYQMYSGQWIPDVSTTPSIITGSGLNNYFILNWPLRNLLTDDTTRFGSFQFVRNQISSGVSTPKYDRSTFWLWVGVASTSVVVAATASVVASVAITKTINRKKASSAAKVESAWRSLVEDPTNPTLASSYTKAVRKANVMSAIVGGTKYSSSNYWLNGTEQKPNKKKGGFTNFLLSPVTGYENTGTLNSLLASGELSNSLITEVERELNGLKGSLDASGISGFNEKLNNISSLVSTVKTLIK